MVLGQRLSTDGRRGLSGPPRSHARHRSAGLQQGDPGPVDFRLSNAQTGAVSVETGTVCMTEGTVRFRTTEPGRSRRGRFR